MNTQIHSVFAKLNNQRNNSNSTDTDLTKKPELAR